MSFEQDLMAIKVASNGSNLISCQLFIQTIYKWPLVLN